MWAISYGSSMIAFNGISVAWYSEPNIKIEVSRYSRWFVKAQYNSDISYWNIKSSNQFLWDVV